MDVVKKYRMRIIQVALFGIFPLLCAFAYCMKDGHVPADVFFPSSYWNDELMYFKQVEAVVNYGLPRGWFGYNEAHGSIYPFAVWNPVILLPWTLWGKIFGWSLIAPIYANIVFNMLALGAFALLVKPTVKQGIFVLGLLGVFVPYTRYMLSGMPEALCMSLGIWFVGLAISYIREEKLWKLFGMTGVVLFLTLSRPYMGLLFLVLIWFAVKRYRIWGILGMMVVMGCTMMGYVWITGRYCAPYIETSIETDWLGIFYREGVWAGISYTFSTLFGKFSYLFDYFLKHAVKYGLFSGALYAVTGLLALVLLLRGIWAFREKKDEKLRWLCLFQFTATAGMILALFLFYRMGEGAKHLMIFIVTGLLITAMLEERRMLLKFFAGVLCLYFFVVKAAAPYDWQVPYDDGALGQEAQELRRQLRAEMVLKDSEELFDNTVIWLASDFVGDESVTAAWGLLYMIPEGYGINFCTWQYVSEHLEELRSGYITVIPEGGIDMALAERNAPVIAETEHMKVYCLRQGQVK